MSEWSLHISKCENGYLCRKETDDGDDYFVIEESEVDELKAHEELLWAVMEYFNFQGSKHDKERISIERRKGKEER